MNIDVICVPIYYGSDRPGVEKGPKTLLEHHVKERLNQHHHIESLTFVHVPLQFEQDKYKDDNHAKYLNSIVKTSSQEKHLVFESLNNNHFPLTIGGDHSLGLGSLTGVLAHNKDTLVIWIDAHADINTPDSTPSGNVHGMPVAAALGYGHPLLTALNTNTLNPKHLLYIGIRDIDKGEAYLINKLNIQAITMDSILNKGINYTLETVQLFLDTYKDLPVHLSFDIDSLDKNLVPGTGTPVSFGFTQHQANTLLEYLSNTKRITSMDFVEFNPSLDKHNKTLKASLELIDTFFLAPY